MLPKLLEKRLRDRKISVRTAAEELNVSHTTLHRIMNGETMDLKTLVNLSNWLGVRPSTILDSDANDEKTSISSTITALIEQDPRLASAFTEIGKELKNGNIDLRDVEDIVSYTIYRINDAKRRNNPINGDN
jgi:transcriptional regulator with XRE-family HTH domain